MEDVQWELIAALLPNGIELNPKEDNSAEITDGNNSIDIIATDKNTYVVNKRTLHFEDTDNEIINTILVPYILQELDGERRI